MNAKKGGEKLIMGYIASCAHKTCFHSTMFVKILIVTSLSRINATTGFCPINTNSSQSPVLTRTSGSDNFVCKDKYIRLHCCALGYKAIHWYYLQDNNDENGAIYQPFEFLNAYLHIWTDDRNQTLVISKAKAKQEYKHWQCKLFGYDEKVKRRNFTLFIQDCGATVPQPIKDTPIQETIKVRRTDNVTIPCAGFFGSSGDQKEKRNSIRWKKRMPTGQPKIFIDGCPARNGSSSALIIYDPRICVNVTKIYDGAGVKSELIIENVQESDFGDYICQMNNGVIDGITNVNITIMEEKYIIISLENKLAKGLIGGAAVFVIIFVIPILFVLYYYKLEIRLCLKRRCSKPVGNGDKDYDVFLVFSEQSEKDRDFTCRLLKEELENKHHYRVCLSERDFEFGEVKVNNYMNSLSRSRCVVMVMSPDFVVDNWCTYVSYMSLSMQNPPKIVFVNFREILSEDWTQNTSILQRLESREKKFVVKIGVKMGCNINWPNQENPSEKKISKFFKKLQLELPLVHNQTSSITSLSQIEADSYAENVNPNKDTSDDMEVRQLINQDNSVKNNTTKPSSPKLVPKNPLKGDDTQVLLPQESIDSQYESLQSPTSPDFRFLLPRGSDNSDCNTGSLTEHLSPKTSQMFSGVTKEENELPPGKYENQRQVSRDSGFAGNSFDVYPSSNLIV